MSKKVRAYNVEKLLIDWKEYMTRNNMTYKEFGDLSGTDASLISKIFRGKMTPSMNEVHKIVRVMGRPLSDYLDVTTIATRAYLPIYEKQYDISTVDGIDELIKFLNEKKAEIIHKEMDQLNLETEKLNLEIEKRKALLKEIGAE